MQNAEQVGRPTARKDIGLGDMVNSMSPNLFSVVGGEGAFGVAEFGGWLLLLLGRGDFFCWRGGNRCDKIREERVLFGRQWFG